jgi:hypothetical protein
MKLALSVSLKSYLRRMVKPISQVAICSSLKEDPQTGFATLTEIDLFTAHCAKSMTPALSDPHVDGARVTI